MLVRLCKGLVCVRSLVFEAWGCFRWLEEVVCVEVREDFLFFLFGGKLEDVSFFLLFCW